MSDLKYHVPTGEMLEIDGQPQLRYVTKLEIASAAAMQEQIATILDAHVESWSSTEFSGGIYLACWNDQMSREQMEQVGADLISVLTELQGVIDENSLTSANGQRLTLGASLSRTESEASA
ncbi:hypothetical protein SAMN02745181_0639 [Rubritalea squalenifaciens DSM 18772]|uniref:Uncharacterized protein n=2 Tax=Rubritalea TaxID=361050 RepID=A0A1M6D3Y0_9BACT|nr:hypothetical protein [Rubritalea squalenifaciens]SHI67946.1 hypothetical protein SAMN02745181_0639 [Rubritalea squalenifaciens DSM 18772]